MRRVQVSEARAHLAELLRTFGRRYLEFDHQHLITAVFTKLC